MREAIEKADVLIEALQWIRAFRDKVTVVKIGGRVIDDEEAPKAEHRQISLPKLAAALAIEGALFALIRGLVDHGSRQAFARATGSWPGEERPEPE